MQNRRRGFVPSSDRASEMLKRGRTFRPPRAGRFDRLAPPQRWCNGTAMRDNPNLDLLRSLAVALVLLSHMPFFVPWASSRGPHPMVLALGHVGVALFFVHTSLVLMLSLERHGAAAGPFLVRRVFRIYPLSIAVVLLVTLIQWLGHQPLDFGLVLSNLLLVQNVTGDKSVPPPLWSLPYELQMYLFLPALYALTRLTGRALRAGLLVAGSVISMLAVSLAAVDRLALLAYVPCFLPGVLAFVLGRHWHPRFGPVPMFILVVGAAVAVPALVGAGVQETPLLWMMCTLLGIAIPLCGEIRNRPLVAAAKVVATYSYSIYLMHMICVGLAFGVLAVLPVPLQWAAFFALLAGLSRIAYHAIEKPGIRLGVRLADALRARGLRDRSARESSTVF